MHDLRLVASRTGSFGEGALPLVCFSGLDMEHVNDFVHGHLHGIVKKVTPSPAHPQ